MKQLLPAGLLVALTTLLACGPGASLVGQVSAPSGAVASAEVTILDSSQNTIQRVMTSADGKFGVKAAMAPGVYVADIRKNGFQPVSKTFTYPDMSSLTISMIPLMTLKGLVRLPDQSVAPQAILRFTLAGTQDQSKVVADSGGAYMVENLDSGTYNIEVETPDGLYGASLTQELSGEGGVTELEIQLDSTKQTLVGAGGEIKQPTIVLDVDGAVAN